MQDNITDCADAQIHFLSEYRRGPFDFWFEETSTRLSLTQEDVDRQGEILEAHGETLEVHADKLGRMDDDLIQHAGRLNKAETEMATHAARLETTETQTASNTAAISENAKSVSVNAAQIASVSSVVSANQVRIAHTEAAISDNAAAIEQVQMQFEQLDLNVVTLSSHLVHAQKKLKAMQPASPSRMRWPAAAGCNPMSASPSPPIGGILTGRARWHFPAQRGLVGMSQPMPHWALSPIAAKSAPARGSALGGRIARRRFPCLRVPGFAE